jgi:hypothetical protein
MQQTVEGVQVASVVGQALAIYSQSPQVQSTQQQVLPPNLDPAADPQRGSAGAGSAQGSQEGVAQNADNAGRATLTPGVGNAGVPVAAGIIRLLPDRLTNDGGEVPVDETEAIDTQGGLPVAPPQ